MLDSAEAVAAGGDNGAVLIAGKPDESALMRAVRHLDPDTAMPPKGDKLSEADIRVLEEWIAAGAEWPKGDVSASTGGMRRRKPGNITEEDRLWWAFQPLKEVAPPEVGEGKEIRNAVDRFILAKLEAEGLKAAPEASAAVLVRRVTFDLTGLPPTPEEVAAFVADKSAGAYERLVDGLLARPAYGERMARHWLDLVRYADGDGYRADAYRPHAWRFRDYVIKAFNDDKPYDRFIQEQLAGDEIFPDSPEGLIATGYLRHGIYEWNARDVRGQWETILNDLTDTTGDAFFGLGLQCARCHDHKFDPILQRDYYRLRAVFAAIQPGDVAAVTKLEFAEHAKKEAAWEARVAPIRERLAALEKPYLDAAEKEAVGRFPDDIQTMIRKPSDQREPLESQLAGLAWRQVVYDWERVDGRFKGDVKEQILSLRRELAALEKDKPVALPVAFAASDVGPRAPVVRIPKRPSEGDIEPGVLTILDPGPLNAVPFPQSTGRRAALARWLTRKDNPLSSRVMVNRVWQQHFGRGLAANASDFGMLGEKPTHPELLDWLAGWFVKEGWSLKKLHRLVVTSAAYRRSSREDPSLSECVVKDPANRLLWHRVPKRLDAEQIRDSMFSVSGELHEMRGGAGKMHDAPVRTIYTRFMRNTRDALADVFDAPQWFTSASSRDTTTTPVQSLLLLNSAALRSRGKAMAGRLEALVPNDVEGQVRWAYEFAFGRSATPEEVAEAVAFIATQESQADPARLFSGQAGFIPDKVPYRDGQAALIEPEGIQRLFKVENSGSMLGEGGFTLEAFMVPRSVAVTGALRTIAAKWLGGHQQPGWALGITGQKSRRKPLTVAIQLVGENHSGALIEYPVFSDLNVQINRPYFIAASVTPATKAALGKVVFSLKDLSNDDEPLLTATVEHPVCGGWVNDVPLTIGGRSGADPNSFDGVLDDVRLSGGALSQPQLLYTAEGVGDSTLGYWKFEAKPDVFADFSGHDRKLSQPEKKTAAKIGHLVPKQAAMADFCHALLNSSEFLYVE